MRPRTEARAPYHRPDAQPPGGRDEPVPAPARPQPGRLVPVGTGCARAGEAARPADLPVDRLRGVPLVPRHGARVVRGRGDRRATSTTASCRSRWTARSGPTSTDLHGRGPGDDRQRRLADVGVPDARGPAVLRRDLLPGRAAPRDAVLPAGARGRRPARGATQRAEVDAPAASARSRALVEQGRLRRPAPTAATRWPCFEAVDAALEALFDTAQRRLGRRAQVPAADDDRVPAPPARRDRRRPARSRSSGSRSTRWPTAGSTTSSAAASTAMPPTRAWLVPHFEQMLYDNAQLARVYLHACAGRLATARYRDVARRRRSTT